MDSFTRLSGVGPGRLVWSDEFDGQSGSPPDKTSWSFEIGDGVAFGNRELQRYTDSPVNAAHDGRGCLALTACATEEGYTSARIVSKGKVEVCYGRIETRLKVPRGAGVWPAIWMLGADIETAPWPSCGEIDVMEHVGASPYRVVGTVHCPGHAGTRGFRGTIDARDELAEAFHIFAADWSPSRIEWSLDSCIYHSATPSDVPEGWVFNHPFYLLINLAIGGELGGPVASETTFPQQLLVDYIRVYAPLTP